MLKRLLSMIVIAATVFCMSACDINIGSDPAGNESSQPDEAVSLDLSLEKDRIVIELAQNYIDEENYDAAKKVLESALKDGGGAEVSQKLAEVNALIDALTDVPSVPESSLVEEPVSELVDEPSSEPAPELSSKVPSSEEPAKKEDIDYASKFVGTYNYSESGEDNFGKITIKRKSNTKISFKLYRENVLCSEEISETIKVGEKDSFSITRSNGVIKYKLTVKLVSKGKLKVTQKVIEVLNDASDGVGLGGTYIAKK